VGARRCSERTRRRLVLAVPLTALLVLVGACSDDAEPELSATATRSSLFDSQRTFRLELVNDGTEEVTVTSIQLRSPRFAEVEAGDRDTELAPGQRLLLPLPYGESVCPGSEEPPVVVAVIDDGSELELPLAQDPEDVMDDLHALECEQQSVRDAVDLSFGDDWQPTGPRSATGVVEVRPTGDTPVEVGAMAGNIVFGVRLAPGALPAVDTFPVEVVVDRCDTHALIESKRTFKFPLDVRLDGGEPITSVLEAVPGTPAREVFADLIQACIG
jgi:hypothetical protein